MSNEQPEVGNTAGERTCWRKSSNSVDWPEWNDCGRDVLTETCERSVEKAVGTTDFPELDTQEWQEDNYDQQGNLLDPVKVKEGKREDIDWVLKQKLFDYVPESECAQRQGRPYSLKWVLRQGACRVPCESGVPGDQLVGAESESR